jgi:hypothetical protein
MKKLFFTLFLCSSFAIVASAQTGKAARKNVDPNSKANAKATVPATASQDASFSTAVSEMEATQKSAKMKTVQAPVPAKKTATVSKLKKS